jgi:hypothetical protein
MDFQEFNYSDEAAAAIQDFLRSSEGKKLPEDVQDKAWEFIRPGGSMNFAVAHFAELLFARAKDIKSNEALQLAASCARVAYLHNIDTLGGRRGVAVMHALRRRSGEKAPEGSKWPPAADDPRPRIQYLPEAEQKKVAASEAKEMEALTEAVEVVETQTAPVTQPLLTNDPNP